MCPFDTDFAVNGYRRKTKDMGIPLFFFFFLAAQEPVLNDVPTYPYPSIRPSKTGIPSVFIYDKLWGFFKCQMRNDFSHSLLLRVTFSSAKCSRGHCPQMGK